MKKKCIAVEIKRAAKNVRKQAPLAGSITNSVTIDFVANAQLAVGGSAACVYMPDEAEAIVAAGGALYINLGTLMPIYEQTIPCAAKAACNAGKPWVLDPVALGIGSLRTKLMLEIAEYNPAIIRGNASEIIALAKLWGVHDGSASEKTQAKGVDNMAATTAALPAAVALAQKTGGAVAVSGEVDIVTDGKLVACSEGGSSLMTRVTGTGCSLGGVCAVYAAVSEPFTAALAAVNHYNLAGHLAAKNLKTGASGPGSFKVNFLDALYNASPKQIAKNKFSLKSV